MKTIALPALIVLIMLTACNNDPKKPVTAGPKTLADSLVLDIDKAHISGMGRMGKLTRMSQYTAFAIDSINKLPGIAKAAAASYKGRLDSLLTDLKYAETAMDKWMMEYKEDSLVTDQAAHTQYLQQEKSKVDAMMSALNNSMKKAEEVLPKKF